MRWQPGATKISSASAFNSGQSPHFTATVALENLSDQKSAASLLGLFRELAASSSAKQH